MNQKDKRWEVNKGLPERLPLIFLEDKFSYLLRLSDKKKVKNLLTKVF